MKDYPVCKVRGGASASAMLHKLSMFYCTEAGVVVDQRHSHHVKSCVGMFQYLTRVLVSHPAVILVARVTMTFQIDQASYYGQEASVAALLGAGVDANALNSNGKSPAYYARKNGHVGCVRLLRGESPSHVQRSECWNSC